jgi:hypothetical protein
MDPVQHIYTVFVCPVHPRLDFQDSRDKNKRKKLLQNCYKKMNHIVPPWMGAAIDELNARYTHLAQSFQGPMLRLQTEADRQIAVLHTPNEEEGADVYVGRYWMEYERQGREIRKGSPTWELDVQVGVDAERLDRLCLMIDFVLFPAEPYNEALYSAEHTVRSEDQWALFRNKILDGLLVELIQRADREAEFARSAESTDEEESSVEDEDAED